MGDAMKLLLGIVMLAVAFIVFPILLTGADTIRGSANITSFTGLSNVVQIAPTVIFVAMIFGGGVLGWFGMKGVRSGGGKKGKSY